MKKRISKIFLALLLIPVLYMSVTSVIICYHLYTAGYDVGEVPAALAVYYGKSGGETVYKCLDTSVFIGRTDQDYYSDIFEKNGYILYDSMGNKRSYTNSGARIKEFVVLRANGNRWFAIYEMIGAPYDIEDFIKNAGGP